MKTVGRFINKLSVRIITMIVLSVTFLTTLSGFFTYQVFTRIMLKESYTYILQVADSALFDLSRYDFFQYYQEIGEIRFEEIARMTEEELEALVDKEEIQFFMAYTDMVARLMYHGMSYDLSKIMLIVPTEEQGYNEYNVVYGQDMHPEETHADIYMLGDVLRASSKEESRILKKIWTEEIEDDYLVDYQDGNSTMTAYKAVKNAQEELIGIIVVSRTIQEMVDTYGRYVIGNAIMGISLVIIGTVILGLYLRFCVVKPVNLIAMEADRFTREIIKKENNLTDDVGKVTEIRFLAESIDKMEEGTMQNIDEITRMSRESERIDTELSLAANLQASVLPKAEKFSERKEFDLAAEMIPAREVGGDFYDFFLLDDTHLVLIIADVSDKGVGAAFFMGIAKTLMKARVRMGGSPAEIISFVEERLSEDNHEGMFFTTWLGIVDLVTGEVKACNAGHNYPAILHKDADKGYKIEKTEHGPPICFLPGMGHKEYTMRLNPGDRLFLYTDGVTEAKNPAGERFENDRLIKALNDDQAIGNASLILRVKAAVDHFAEGEPQFDDMTMVSFTFLGKG